MYLAWIPHEGRWVIDVIYQIGRLNDPQDEDWTACRASHRNRAIPRCGLTAKHPMAKLNSKHMGNLYNVVYPPSHLLFLT